MASELSEREKTVLRYVVHDFIETALPVGSRYISRRHEDNLGLSSASIRNVLSDLEYLGYINHPHTSAGRVPTDLGYRFYLDYLMEKELLSETEKQAIRENLDKVEDQEELLSESSRLLGIISRQLGVVTSPELSSGTFEKLEMVQILSSRIMIIISIKSGLVRTIMLEVRSEIPREKLDEISSYLNERLGGLTLKQIKESFALRMKDLASEETGLIRLFIDSVDKLFVPPRVDQVHISGTEKIIEQPEFVDPRNFRSVIELINDEEMIIHVLEKHEGSPMNVTVTIGGENEEEKLKPLSVISTTYTVGDVTGTIGVIGPKRMAYHKMIPLIDFVAQTVSEMLTGNSKT